METNQPRYSLRYIVTAFSAILLIPLVIAGVLVVGAIATRSLVEDNYIGGEFVIVVLIGILGGIGGSVSAARDGTISFPTIDPAEPKKIVLGSVNETVFGAVGAYMVFLLIPGVSDHTATLGKASFAPNGSQQAEPTEVNTTTEPTSAANSSRANGSTSNRARTDPADATPMVGHELKDEFDLDWVELIAIALVGGYAGRAVINRAAQLYVTKEELEKVGQEAKQAAMVEFRGEIDALRLVSDQLDLSTPPPNLAQLQEAVRDASATLREFIYVESRRRFSDKLEQAELRQDQAKATNACNRVLPIMETLRQVDPEERYRGCRYLLAVASHHLGNDADARRYLEEAERISQRRHNAVPPEYAALRAKLGT